MGLVVLPAKTGHLMKPSPFGTSIPTDSGPDSRYLDRGLAASRVVAAEPKYRLRLGRC
jgi:hypothetical protein